MSTYDAGSIHVRRAWVVAPDGKRCQQGPKTEAGDRTLYMTEDVRTALRAHLATYVGPRRAPGFFPEQGRHCTCNPSDLLPCVGAGSTGLRREDLRFHDLRHSGLTWFAQAGAAQADLMHQPATQAQRQLADTSTPKLSGPRCWSQKMAAP